MNQDIADSKRRNPMSQERNLESSRLKRTEELNYTLRFVSSVIDVLYQITKTKFVECIKKRYMVYLVWCSSDLVYEIRDCTVTLLIKNLRNALAAEIVKVFLNS